jgi:hypothetical protein
MKREWDPEKEGTISLKAADIALYEAIYLLEFVEDKLTNVRDFISPPLDKGRIEKCIALVKEASNMAKKAYWKYLDKEYNSPEGLDLIQKHVDDETLRDIFREIFPRK